ncbi:MAG: phosphoglycolate phosphatase [Magnetospirillum sp.]|nr:phosphoglycolate phosphatase [Magnetospirillum sp.]
MPIVESPVPQGRIAAVVFDLDGTLIDSLPDLAAAVNRLLAEEGRPPLSADEVKVMVGDGAGTLVERAFAARGGLPGPEVAPYLARFLADYEPRAAELTRPWPGVIETLERLKADGLSLAVCTNKPSRATDEVLAALGLTRFFDVVVGGDDVRSLKPDPAHVRVTLDRLGVTAAEAAMIGDSVNDVLAATAAGVPSVVVSFGYCRGPAAELGADLVIDDFRELPQALTALVRPPVGTEVDSR